jgi:hypothetical protein
MFVYAKTPTKEGHVHISTTVDPILLKRKSVIHQHILRETVAHSNTTVAD